MQIDEDILSVIIPVYNEEKNIKKILEALECQSIYGFNVIVIDDGSYDKTATIIKNYKPKKYNLTLLQQKNKGAALARQVAINKSTSQFIALLDCDDGISFDALEKALAPVLECNDIDISLFQLIYVNTIEDKKRVTFEYYTSKKILSGMDVFDNCIRSWGVHGFGIYKKEIILKAYKIYNEINIRNENFLNNDEVVSRISFDISKKIAITNGEYYFVNNKESTTRRVNSNYFKVVNNAFILLTYIKKKRKKIESSSVIDDINSLIISTIWGVCLRYIKWRVYLSKDERLQWKLAIRDGVEKITTCKVSCDLKGEIKLLIIKCLIIKGVI